jgi:preprotein translocase subunit SecD
VNVAVGDNSKRRWRRNGKVLAVFAGATMLTACASTTPTPQSAPTPRPRDLQLRPVLAMAPLGNATCPATSHDAASSTTPVSACSADGTTLYTLGAAAVTGNQVSAVSVQDSAGSGTSQIQVTFDHAGTAALATLTTQLAAKSEPQSQMAIYVHGRVQSAPLVMAPITAGVVAIAGNFTKAKAQQLVDGLAAG